jgi:hypothetical protein
MTERQLLALLAPFVKAPDDGELKPRDFYILVANRIREAVGEGTYPGGPNYQNPEAVEFQEARAAPGRAKI